VNPFANPPRIMVQSRPQDMRAGIQRLATIVEAELGCDPDGDGNPEKMLAWDKARALEIHNAVKDFVTPFTESGHPVYYFDANGRYDTVERLSSLVDFLVREGIAERTVLFEEPFAPENKIYLGDLPICFAADESAHSLSDVKERIELGYGAITLKPIAKTSSVTVKMERAAREAGVQCFCADLTVNPIMVEWNKNFAARLRTLRGMKIGVVESNGAQNYVRWGEMKKYVTRENTETDASIYTLDGAFFKNAGGLFEISEHYLGLIRKASPEFFGE